MFSNFANKNTFGTPASTSTFGFGSATPSATPFGQTQQFGKTTASTFGTAPPLFGQTQQQTTAPLFSNTSFGSTPSSGFGSGLFGQQQPSAANGLFTNTAASTFGQQNKPPGFGFGSTSTPSTLFGQQQPPSFQSSTTTGVFGNTPALGGTTQMGTVTKFNPVTGTDTMQKSGLTHSISTKHHCITCMKEYENKSLEELRWEDYQCNRKGPQQQSTFGTPAFGSTAVSSAPSLFGQTSTTAPAFGTTSTAFGLGNPSNQQSLFGKTPTNTFGSTPTSNAFGFNTPASNAFGVNNANKSTFGTPTTNVFSTPAQQPAFVTNSFFGSTNNQTSSNSFFTSKPQTTFNTQQPSSFAFGQNNLFQTPKTTPGFGSTFTQPTLTSNAGFTTGTNLFSQTSQNPFNNLQKPATQTAFGQPTQTGFGLGTQPATNTLFGNTAAKPLFGNTTSTNLFGNTNSFAMPQAQQPLGTTNFSSLETQPQPEFNKTVSEIYDYFPRREFLLKSTTTYETTDPDELKDIVDGMSPITDTNKTSKLRVIPKLGMNSYKSEMQQPHYSKSLGEIIERSISESPTILGSGSGRRLNLSKTRITPKNTSQSDSFSNASLSHVNTAAAPSPKFDGSMFKNIQTLSNSDSNKTSSLSSPTIGQSTHHQIVDGRNSLNESTNQNTPPSNFVREMNALNNSANTITTSAIVHDRVDSNRSILKNSTPKTPDIDKENRLLLETPVGDTVSKDRKKVVKSVCFTDEISSFQDDLVSQIDLLKENVAEFSDLSDEELSADKLTCGIKLTRPEYYTLPPLNELPKYKDSEGRCFIKGFTIGRTGFGNIYFADEMDVSNLNLDDIVHFRYREVQVYPNDGEKPPVGQGLNRSAQVTLDNVWPKDMQTQRIMKDPQEIAENNFIDRLCILSEKQNATFLDYRPETGSWVFVVQHFSKYKFSNEDDEETIKMLEAKNLARSKEAAQVDVTALEQQHDANANEESMEVIRRDLGGTNSVDDFRDYDGIRYHNQIGAHNIGAIRDDLPLYQQDLHQLKYSFGHDPKNASDIYLMKSCLLDEEESSIVNDIGILDMDTETFPLSSLSSLNLVESQPQELVLQPVVDQSPYYTIKLLNGVIPKEKSLLKAVQNYKDIGVFKGQSFKTGWGRGLRLSLLAPQLHNVMSTQLVNLECSFNSVLNLQWSTTSRNKENKIDLEEHLKVVLEGSISVTNSSGVPFFKSKEGFDTLLQHYQRATFFDLEHNNENTSHFTDTLNLCRAFWGPDAGTPTQRLELFSEWLKETSKSLVEEEMNFSSTMTKESIFKNVFVLLSGHQIERAAEMALNFNLPHLAMLIAQCGSNDFSRQLMYNQVEEWRKSHAMHFMDRNLIKIYMLLGGIPAILDIHVCENLDWKRSLGIHLWYMIPAGTSLIHGIQEYQKAFFELSYAREPNPPYGKAVVSGMYDVQYNIMLLFMNRSLNLNKVLNPLTYTNNPLDYRLSWILLEIFISLKIGTISKQCANYIRTSFATQLEDMFMWKWAIFVLLFIDDLSIRDNLVPTILYRNLNPDRSDKENLFIENNLINDFKLSPKLVHNVLSYKSATVLESFKHLILAENWNRAYRLALEKLIPDLSLSGQGTDLHALLKSLAPGSTNLSTWEKDVGLILEFLNIKEDLITKEDELNEFELERYGSQLLNLSSRIKNIQPTSAEQAVAIKSIC